MNIQTRILNFFRSRSYAVPGTILLVLILVPLLSWAIFPPRRVWRTMYFPGVIEDRVSPERRALPRGGGRIHQIELLLEDLILGPVSIEKASLISPETSVNTVMVHRGNLFIDFSEHAMMDEDEMILNFSEAAEVLKRIIDLNFPGYGEIIISIRGRQMHEPYFSIPEDEIESQ